MPTFMDIAADGKFDDYIDPIDGQSLLGALQGKQDTLSDVVISEFAADGSTGPSRMVRKGPWKYMYLEGEDTLLYNIEADWDPDYWRSTISLNQKQRLKIHQVTGGDPTYVLKVRDDDDQRYIRNAGAADTKARARLPYVEPAKPD